MLSCVVERLGEGELLAVLLDALTRLFAGCWFDPRLELPPICASAERWQGIHRVDRTPHDLAVCGGETFVRAIKAVRRSSRYCIRRSSRFADCS
jgi:hypothetical protein